MNLDTAIKLATDAHADQVDKAGEPYILHRSARDAGVLDHPVPSFTTSCLNRNFGSAF